MGVHWKRHRDGDASTIWTATIGNTDVAVANMRGQSVRYSGVGAHVLVWRVDGDSWKEVHADWTVTEAKTWAERKYEPVEALK